MGTRSLTYINDGVENIVCLYRQYDGYPSGLGKELYEFLRDFNIVNGYGKAAPTLANGIGCLAAQVIKKLKVETGNVYIYPPNSTDCGEEFTYTITTKNGKVYLKVDEIGWGVTPTTTIFTGEIRSFGAFLESQKEKVAA